MQRKSYDHACLSGPSSGTCIRRQCVGSASVTRHRCNRCNTRKPHQDEAGQTKTHHCDRRPAFSEADDEGWEKNKRRENVEESADALKNAHLECFPAKHMLCIQRHKHLFRSQVMM